MSGILESEVLCLRQVSHNLSDERVFSAPQIMQNSLPVIPFPLYRLGYTVRRLPRRAILRSLYFSMLVFNNSFLSLIYSETLEKTYDASSKDSIAYVTTDSVTPVISNPLYLL